MDYMKIGDRTGGNIVASVQSRKSVAKYRLQSIGCKECFSSEHLLTKIGPFAILEKKNSHFISGVLEFGT